MLETQIENIIEWIILL